MPTATTTTTTPEASQSAPKTMGAIEMLRADHKVVSALFAEYEKARFTRKKRAIVARICDELSVHAQLEEEIFYPAVKRALKDTEMVPGAKVEHASLKALIPQVEGVEPYGEMFDAKIKVLSEYVVHHVHEEQNDMFPKAKASKLDLSALGAEMAARKQELQAERKVELV